MKTYGVNLILSSTKPIRTNYNFLGWATSQNASAPQYAPGATYINNESVTLYAVWNLSYWEPKITNLAVNRCKSDGTLDDFGTYAKITFNWECCQIVGSNNVKSISIKYKPSSSSSWSSTSVTSSGTTGKVSTVIGNGSLSIDNGYDFQVAVADSKNGSTTLSYSIGGAIFPIDFKAGGKGVAIGKAATKNIFDIGMATSFDSRIDIKDFIYDQFGTRIGNGLAKHDSSGIDPNTTLEELIVTNRNTPISSSYMYIQTMFYGSKSTSSNRAQIALPYNTNGSMYHRYYVNGAWTSWKRHVNEDELDDFKESTWYGTGNPYGNSLKVWILRQGKLCTCDIEWIGATGGNKNGTISELTIPQDYRPFKNAFVSIETVSSGSAFGATRLMINSSTGKISFVTDQTAYVERYATFTYRVA